MPEYSKEYAQALADYNAVSASYRDAALKYRARIIGDDEFIAAANALKLADAAFGDALLKELNA